MRALWLACLFGAVLVAQGPASPATPFPNHELPPKGWYCVPADTAERVQTNDHACDCLGMRSDPICRTEGQDENGNPIEVRRTTDNSRCKVYCHKDHCACASQCDGS